MKLRLAMLSALPISILALSTPAHAALTTIYSNGFETDTADWSAPTRVASGSGGITSASGSFHATTAAGAGDFTRWGGYNYGAGSVPTTFLQYMTSVNIYLNVSGGWANNTRFDFDSAISSSSGAFLRDFIFNAGFYNSDDLIGPGAGTDRFVISTGNNSQPGSANAKDPGHAPIAISTTGWYTFQQHFYDNAGVLAVDMIILDSANTQVGLWTLSDPADLISAVGGNRYGWFDFNQFSTLAFDNASLSVATAPVPEPTTVIAGALLLLPFGISTLRLLRRKQTE